MLRQILQICKDQLAQFEDFRAKFEALQADLDVLNATAVADLQAIKATVEATEASFEAFQVEMQAAHVEAACMDRKISKLEEAVANAATRFPQRMRARRLEHSKGGRVVRR
jgi:predicted  nucleic acid-binding Zn-ribbon protein